MITRARTNVQLGAVAKSFAWANSSLFAPCTAGVSPDASSRANVPELLITRPKAVANPRVATGEQGKANRGLPTVIGLTWG
jgi:hypothetical protein